MSAKESFKRRLLGLQGNLLNFAYQLTTNREQAEDLLQDTTLKALDNEEKYVDNVNFKGWIFTIMRNIFINTAAIHGFQDPAMAEALARFDLLNDINAAMQGLRGENFAGFMHTISATNHAHNEIIEDVECFRTSAQDTTAMRPVSRVVGLSVAVK